MNNYHTHTWRCRHADGDIGDYVTAARRAGLGELGFSDHMPWHDGRWPSWRMTMAQLPGYIAELEGARRAESLRPDGLSLLAGLECEYGEEEESYLRDVLLGEYGLDYLAAGIHSYEADGGWRDSFFITDTRGLLGYARQVEKAAASGLFSFLAHPDVFCNGYWSWNAEAEACARDVLAACEEARLPLEVNGYGLRKPLVPSMEGRRPPYPHPRFWEIAADYDIEALPGSDAHTPTDVGSGLVECRELAEGLGIRILEGLPVLKAR